MPRKSKTATPIRTPAQVAVFVDALGIDLTIQFLLKFGGLEVSLPSTRFTRGSEVVTLLGAENTTKLIAHADRIPKRIPKADKWIGQIWLSRGMGATAVARRLRVTDTTARKWKAELAQTLPSPRKRKPSPPPDQLDLFNR